MWRNQISNLLSLFESIYFPCTIYFRFRLLEIIHLVTEGKIRQSRHRSAYRTTHETSQALAPNCCSGNKQFLLDINGPAKHTASCIHVIDGSIDPNCFTIVRQRQLQISLLPIQIISSVRFLCPAAISSAQVGLAYSHVPRHTASHSRK